MMGVMELDERVVGTDDGNADVVKAVMARRRRADVMTRLDMALLVLARPRSFFTFPQLHFGAVDSTGKNQQ